MGSAHPAVGGVIGYTLFLLWFSCHLVYIFIFIIFVVLRVPLLTFGPPGRFSAGVTQDVASDSVPFLGFRLLAMSGLVCYLTRSLDICL